MQASEVADSIRAQIAELDQERNLLHAALVALEGKPVRTAPRRRPRRKREAEEPKTDTVQRRVRLAPEPRRAAREVSRITDEDVLALVSSGMDSVRDIAAQLEVPWQTVGGKLKSLRIAGRVTKDGTTWRAVQPTGNWTEPRAREALAAA